MPDNVEQNTADQQGAGIFGPRGRIENNTIYGNVSDGGIGGVFLEPYIDSSNDVLDDEAFVFQNNIIWENENQGATNDNEQYSESLNGYMEYCALDVPSTVSVSGTHVTNPSGTTDLDFDSVSLGTPPDYGAYLHIGDNSPCIDAGQPDQTQYGDDSVTDPVNKDSSAFIARDFDDQLSFFDDPNSSDSGPPPLGVNHVKRDIGADEYPTDPIGFTYWWEATRALE